MTSATPIRQSLAERFRIEHGLPGTFRDDAVEFYEPLVDWLAAMPGNAPLTLGINGAQGTGKSTLAEYLAEALRRRHGWQVALVSIDDVYLTRAQRQVLSTQVHPLLATRGVPGTHDLPLLLETLNALETAGPGQVVALPRFDKIADERRPQSEWPIVRGPVRLVILEGWCVGTPPEDDAALEAPINDRERDEDPNGIWRRYVNDRLRNDYPAVFDRLGALIFLQAPDFDSVIRWRIEQERGLAGRAEATMRGPMSAADIARFVALFERLTRHSHAALPDLADVIVELDRGHRVRSMHMGSHGPRRSR